MATEFISFHTSSDREAMRQDVRSQLVAKLSNKEYRDIFVSEQVNTGLSFQIRGLREQRGWSQAELGNRSGMAQSRISVLEDANYSRFSLSTLKRLASAFDVGLIVRFAPFSELVTQFVNLNARSLEAPPFRDDQFFPQTIATTPTMTLSSEAGAITVNVAATTDFTPTIHNDLGWLVAQQEPVPFGRSLIRE